MQFNIVKYRLCDCLYNCILVQSWWHILHLCKWICAAGYQEVFLIYLYLCKYNCAGLHRWRSCAFGNFFLQLCIWNCIFSIARHSRSDVGQWVSQSVTDCWLADLIDVTLVSEFDSILLMKVSFWWKLTIDKSWHIMKVVYWWKLK